MNDVKEKADIARANAGDPTPWILIAMVVIAIVLAIVAVSYIA